MKQTVFIVQDDPGKNLTPARKFGTLRTIFNSRYQVYTSANEAVGIAASVLSSFNWHDYLLLVGDPVLISICSMEVSRRFDTVNVLKWDRQEKEYWPIAIQSKELMPK